MADLYQAGHSVIEENISEANMLHSFDSKMQISIKKGQNFKDMMQANAPD